MEPIEEASDGQSRSGFVTLPLPEGGPMLIPETEIIVTQGRRGDFAQDRPARRLRDRP